VAKGAACGQEFLPTPPGRQYSGEPVPVGSEAIADTGVIALTGPAMGQKHLVLQVDPPTTAARPAPIPSISVTTPIGLTPMLEFDPAVVKAEFDKRLGKRFFAWQDTNVRLERLRQHLQIQPEILQNATSSLSCPAHSTTQSPQGAGNPDFQAIASSRRRISG